MSDLNSKKRKFLKPVEFAVAALLSIAVPAIASTVPSANNSQGNTPTVNTALQTNNIKQKQLLVKPPLQKGKTQIAGHYSHYSHASHSSHSSHYSSSR